MDKYGKGTARSLRAPSIYGLEDREIVDQFHACTTRYYSPQRASRLITGRIISCTTDIWDFSFCTHLNKKLNRTL
jgi:hypothetical protein